MEIFQRLESYLGNKEQEKELRMDTQSNFGSMIECDLTHFVVRRREIVCEMERVALLFFRNDVRISIRVLMLFTLRRRVRLSTSPTLSRYFECKFSEV
uniref:Uncharacterized protein n=1 Tax=Pristionchus pacificus TaxID=54126 RepID=A0A2A6CXR9_PRIPA|eukprot:PDM83024.1 hypothetical protein PRIPAC_37417 [Pristionchus pacificus]